MPRRHERDIRIKWQRVVARKKTFRKNPRKRMFIGGFTQYIPITSLN